MSKTLWRYFVGGQPPADTGNTMEEKRGIHADWSQLPFDLIEKIAGTLDEDIADRVRFGAVCKSWQSAVKSTANLHRVRLPWLCLLDVERRQQTNFFSMCRNKHYDILNTHLQIEALSSHGWILTVDSGKTAWLLLNPITKVQILLPLPPSDPDEIYRSELIVTPDSLAVVMVGFSHGPILCYRRPLDPKGVEITGGAWTEIFCGMGYDVEGTLCSSDVFTYHQDRCFILAKQGVTSIVDPDTRQVVSVIPPMIGTDIMYPPKDGDDLDIRYRYLIRSSSGEELFLVISPSRTAKEIFEVFVFDRSDQHQAKWSKVRNIGQDVLFVGSYGALATLAPRDSNICRRNCVVFSGFCAPHGFVESMCGMFDIGTDSVEELTALNCTNPTALNCTALNCINLTALNCKNLIDQRWFLPSLS